uniref:Uncharacterized protein n=1 Tax=Rhodosorus marinus TaxID=101924 RepID=A0A7S3E837_9RHOD|mmetsp:Transcript_16431/g.67733  ORF Transcript_16431/g.67733 Transcript_16431/m.67733 type:complete len:104 (+) Transcript_16431:120-431(+)
MWYLLLLCYSGLNGMKLTGPDSVSLVFSSTVFRYLCASLPVNDLVTTAEAQAGVHAANREYIAYLCYGTPPECRDVGYKRIQRLTERQHAHALRIYDDSGRSF